MKLIDLYSRVVETTGLEVITTDSINAAISNCFADLTSRGYRDFEELDYPKEEIQEYKNNLSIVDLPTNVRKIIYVRVSFKKMMWWWLNNGLKKISVIYIQRASHLQ
jgi:hypothetical protein